jgi:multicomponent Na+:H+ antiporter subunit C
MAFTVGVVLLGIGLVTIAIRRDLVIKLLALGLTNAGSILCIVAIADRPEARVPICTVCQDVVYADPLPQALVLSAIVINFAILALALVFVMRLVEHYHGTDSRHIEDLVQRDVDEGDDR